MLHNIKQQFVILQNETLYKKDLIEWSRNRRNSTLRVIIRGYAIAKFCSLLEHNDQRI